MLTTSPTLGLGIKVIGLIAIAAILFSTNIAGLYAQPLQSQQLQQVQSSNPTKIAVEAVRTGQLTKIDLVTEPALQTYLKVYQDCLNTLLYANGTYPSDICAVELQRAYNHYCGTLATFNARLCEFVSIKNDEYSIIKWGEPDPYN